MASEVRTFSPQIPAGTAIAAPVTISLPMPARIVTSIRWRVPNGHFGQVGWAVAMSDVKIIPWGDGQWIVANDEWDEIPLDNYPTSGAWQLIGYNLGINPHTVYLTFNLALIGAAVAAPVSGPLLVVPSPAAVVSVATASPVVPVAAPANQPSIVAPAY